MNQSLKKSSEVLYQQSSSIRIAWVQASWHESIINNAYESFIQELALNDIAHTQVESFSVPGSFEIPLVIRRLANTQCYDIAVGCGFVVDGGIYRHDFVAQSVINGLMQVQLDTDIPVLSAVLTPHHFHEHQIHEAFFHQHMQLKGTEVAKACVQTLRLHKQIMT